MRASFYSDVVYFYNVCLDHTNSRMLKQFGMLIKYVSAEFICICLQNCFHKDSGNIYTYCFIVYYSFNVSTYSYLHNL